MKKCSKCHLPGHTKASHRGNPQAHRRKNPQFFVDQRGILHPIRAKHGQTYKKLGASWGGAYHDALASSGRGRATAKRKARRSLTRLD